MSRFMGPTQTAVPSARACVFGARLIAIPASKKVGSRSYAEPHMQIALSGNGRRRLTIGSRELVLSTSPAMIELYGAGYEIARTEWDGEPGECVGLSFPRAITERFLLDDGRRFELASAHEVFDAEVSRVGFQLADEVRRGMPHGVLFAEGLCLTLMGLLSLRHGPARRSREGGVALSSRQRRLLETFIDGKMGTELTIERMSALLGMSPYQFTRRFKASFGLPPHRHVMHKRLLVAERMLREERGRPIAEIALEVGFSSQAHFTAAFRQYMGTTPARLRWD
jgi:AraC family transcriptional regulator